MANCVSKADAYCHLKVFRRWDPDYQWVGRTLSTAMCASSSLLACDKIEVSKEKSMTTPAATTIVYPETDGMPLPDGEFQAPLYRQNRRYTQDSLQGYSRR